MSNLSKRYGTSLNDFDTLFDNMNKRMNNLLEIGFGVPTNIQFNTPNTKDMMPATWQKVYDEDGSMIGYLATCRTVGINPEDIKVKLFDNYVTNTTYSKYTDGIILDGETKETIHGIKKVYTQHVELPISNEVMNNIKNITYETFNGMTYIYLEMEVSKRKSIEIKCLNDITNEGDVK